MVAQDSQAHLPFQMVSLRLALGHFLVAQDSQAHLLFRLV